MSRKGRREGGSPDLLAGVEQALADPDPLNLLSMVSMLLCVTDKRQENPFTPAAPGGPTLDELVASFIDVACPETTALLTVIGAMSTGNDLLRKRVQRELNARPAPENEWLAQLSAPVVTRAVLMSHELGDGDDIMIAAQLPNGYEFTCVIYIDHNVGTLVKDGFVVPAPIAEIVTVSQSEAADGARWDDLSLADARAWIDEGIERAAMTVPPFESESWPGCRALVEWVTRTLPEGGSEYQRPEWGSQQKHQLAQRFFGSPEGARLDDDDHRDLLVSLLWFATDYGSGDPLRWSNVKVEILLIDWLPRKVMAPVDYLAKAPGLLRAYIRFAHAEVGLSPNYTDQALAAVDAFEPHYQHAIRDHDPDDPLARAAELSSSIIRSQLEGFAACVGGRDVLDQLDDVPLPDEAFHWDGVADDVVPLVREILALTDRCCEEVLDVEYRTASRRLLARIAVTDPSSFGRGKVEPVAAAVVWIIGRANNLFDERRGGMRVKDLLRQFGIQKGGVSQRAVKLLAGGGFDADTHMLRLGSVDYLVSERRRSIIAARDRYQSRVM